MKQIYIFSFSMLSILFPFSLKSFDGNASIVSGGMTRNFVFHAPGSSVGQNLPLLIVFHGTGGTGQGIKGYSGFDAVADQQNFLVVYPDAALIGGSAQWNVYVDDQPGHGGVGEPTAPDDVLFTSDLIHYFCTTYDINPAKVYVSGHSNGGFLCYNLSVQLPGMIAAFAPVAANMWGDNTFITNYFTNSYVPVPLIHHHGDADNVVAYPDADFTSNFDYPLSSYGYGNCNSGGYVSTDVVPNLKKLTYCDGSNSNGKQVLMYRIVGGGHGWPVVNGYNTALNIWNFCNQYTLANPSLSCANNTSAIEEINPVVRVYPTVTSSFLYVDHHANENAGFRILDMQGREVHKGKLAANAMIDVTMLSQGNYVVEINISQQPQTFKFIKN